MENNKALFGKGKDYKVANVKYRIKEGGQAPTQGLHKDFGTDLYLQEDVLLIPATIEANIVGVGLHTEFEPNQFGMLITLRSSMSLVPLSLANHVGVIEGTYRGEIKLPLRNTLNTRMTGSTTGSETILEWVEEDKKLEKVNTCEIPEELHTEVFNTLWQEFEDLGSSMGEFRKLTRDYGAGRLPIGTVLLRKGTRVAQAFIAPKYVIDWEKAETLSETERGTGGFGSTN